MKGNLPISRSRTAIIGYLAARAAGISNKKKAIPDWLESHEIEVGERGIRDALERRSVQAGDSLEPDETGWIREVVEFDPTKLNLDVAIVVFPSVDEPARLEASLRSTRRILRIFRTYESDVIAIVVYEGARERQKLQTALEELHPSLRWMVIRAIDDSPAETMWLDLARQAAEAEGLHAR